MTNEIDNNMMIGSVELTFTVLESLHVHQPARVITLANDLDISRSTVYKHLQTLQSLGYIEKNGVSYTISDKFQRFTDSKPTTIDINQANQKVVDSITNMTGEVCGIYIIDGHRGIDWYQSVANDDITPVELEPHLHSHAAGKAALTTLDRTDFEAFVNEVELSALTENTITDPKALREEVERIRDRGIAFGREEHEDGVRSIAVPVSEETGFRGALYVVGPKERLNGKGFDEHLPGLLLSNVGEIVAVPHR